MNKLKFSHEPIVWIGAIVSVLMVVTDYLNGDLSYQSFDALLVAVGAVIGRKFVVPVPRASSQAVQAFRDGQSTAKFNEGGD